MQIRHAVPAVVLVEHIAIAIAQHEGYWTKGSLGHRNNNPGNLRWWGNEKRRDGFVHFMTPADGFRALRLQVWKNVVKRKLNLYEFFAGNGDYAGFAPSADNNDPARYAGFVRDHLAKYGLDIEEFKPVCYHAHDIAALEEDTPYPGLGYGD